MPHLPDAPATPLARGRLYDPRTISLHLTDLCNEACVFCAADTAAGKRDGVESGDLLAILDAHPPADWPTVNIHGGEPTIRPDFLELLGSIRSRGYRRVILQTNALRMANPFFAAAVHEIGVDVFVSGFHAADAVTATRVTRNPKAFELALRGFEAIKQGGAVLRVTTVMCAENFTDLPAIARLCVARGVDHLNFSALQPQDFARASLVPYDACRPYLEAAIGVALSAGLVVTLEGVPYCTCAGYEALHVDWRAQNLKVAFHDLVIDDFNTFLNATTRVWAGPCSACLLRAECGGVYRDYLATHGDVALEPYTREAGDEAHHA
jgi:MoaA/NifB/PqqE/SkfB family radical SAM enzyme